MLGTTLNVISQFVTSHFMLWFNCVSKSVYIMYWRQPIREIRAQTWNEEKHKVDTFPAYVTFSPVISACVLCDNTVVAGFKYNLFPFWAFERGVCRGVKPETRDQRSRLTESQSLVTNFLHMAQSPSFLVIRPVVATLCFHLRMFSDWEGTMWLNLACPVDAMWESGQHGPLAQERAMWAARQGRVNVTDPFQR